MELIEKFPKHELVDDSLYSAAESARGSEDHEVVLTLATRLFKEYPESPFVNRMTLVMAQSLIDLGRHPEAAKQLEALSGRRLDPVMAASARYYRAVALRADGKLDQALSALGGLATDAFQDSEVAQIAVDAQFLSASCYVEKKEYSKAAPLLEKYLALKPDGDVAGHALSYLAVSRAVLGQYEQLRATLVLLRNRVARELSFPVLYQVAEICYEAKEYSLAAELFGDIAQQDPAGRLHAKALSGLGWALYQQNEFAAAVGPFRDLVEAHPNDPLAGEAAYMIGRALEADSKPDQAVTAYRTVVARYAQQPQAFDAGLQLARTLHKTGRLQDSVAAYRDLTERFAKNPSLDVVFYEWAWLHAASNQRAEAQRIFERLARQFPNSPLVPEATLNLAESDYEAGRYQEVVTRLEPLLKQELPSELREPALYRLGRTQVELENWSEAKSCFDSLAQEFPESPLRREGTFWAAEAERQQGQPKAAAERLTRLVAELVELEPWIGTAWLRLAQCQGEQKQWKEMLSTLEELKKRFPNYELANVAEYHAGRAYQNLARFDDARAAYRRAIAGRSDENAAQSQFMIGETYFHQRRHQEALREFLKVEILYAFPQWQAAALLEAAKCYESLQEWSRAAETYNRILEKYPKTSHAATAAERLPAARNRLAPSTSNGKGTP
jgi:TolA-binding protein